MHGVSSRQFGGGTNAESFLPPIRGRVHNSAQPDSGNAAMNMPTEGHKSFLTQSSVQSNKRKAQSYDGKEFLVKRATGLITSGYEANYL